MKKESAFQELQRLASQCGASILYKPLRNEVDYNNSPFPLEIQINNLTLPNNKDGNPFEWAAKCIAKFKNTKPYILIPGTQFDKYGTRYGKGVGWYDRFLSKVPGTWLRIGIAHKSQISNTQLVRQGWDEPVDWIIVHNNNLWEIYKIGTIKSRIQ